MGTEEDNDEENQRYEVKARVLEKHKEKVTEKERVGERARNTRIPM